MLRSVKNMVGYQLSARDGKIGSSKDYLFDENQWTVRYLVADTGSWLPGRKVLVSPISLKITDWTSKAIPVDLTKQQIEDSPPLDSDAPVSRQFEIEWYSHFSWPFYWQGGATWGTVPVPTQAVPVSHEAIDTCLEAAKECHLRSAGEVVDYAIDAVDGKIGKVDDFLFDDQDWRIRYLVVDTGNWLPGKKVVLSPEWIKEISWPQSTVFVSITQEEVENSPEYEPTSPIDRAFEERLYKFYRRPIYWK